jgi:hypothetical protein
LPQHDHYEELCALAVSGQLADEESKNLAAHAAACAGCRNLLDDFAQIAAQALPQFAEKHNRLKIPTGMTERFVARGRSEGIPLARKSEGTIPKRSGWLRAFAWQTAAATTILVVVLSVRLFKSHSQNAPSGSAATEQQALSDSKALREQLAALQAQMNVMDRTIESDRQALRSAELNKLKLSARLADLEKETVQLHRDLDGRDVQVAQLNSEAAQVRAALARLSSAKASVELAVQADQSELHDLRLKVTSLTEQLNESQALSAAANQAKDLIIARNLHIVDVDDSDGAGRRQRPFGRIFYTEGKNLVFYAYDLSDMRKVNAKINFYVWGSQEGINKPVRSLGIFRRDDPKEGRWVLKFDDPRVLAQINCVFVTAESATKDIKKPTGQQILFASLGKTNHP